MKANFGAIIVDGRGKLGGHVSQRNTYGNIIRTKMTPINRRTVPQQTRRAIVADLTANWGALTDIDRTQWKELATSTPVKDVFGNTMHLSGFNWYCSVNLNLISVGEERKDRPRKRKRLGARLYKIEIKLLDTPINVRLESPIAIEAGYKLIVLCTGPLSPGLASAGSQYKKIAVLDDTAIFPYDITTEYVSQFGDTTQVGERAFVKVIEIDTDSGFASPPLTNSTIIEVTPPP